MPHQLVVSRSIPHEPSNPHTIHSGTLPPILESCRPSTAPQRLWTPSSPLSNNPPTPLRLLPKLGSYLSIPAPRATDLTTPQRHHPLRTKTLNYVAYPLRLHPLAGLPHARVQHLDVHDNGRAHAGRVRRRWRLPRLQVPDMDMVRSIRRVETRGISAGRQAVSAAEACAVSYSVGAGFRGVESG